MGILRHTHTHTKKDYQRGKLYRGAWFSIFHWMSVVPLPASKSITHYYYYSLSLSLSPISLVSLSRRRLFSLVYSVWTICACGSTGSIEAQTQRSQGGKRNWVHIYVDGEGKTNPAGRIFFYVHSFLLAPCIFFLNFLYPFNV